MKSPYWTLFSQPLLTTMKHDLPRRLGAAGPHSAAVVSSSTLYSDGCISSLLALIAEEKKTPYS